MTEAHPDADLVKVTRTTTSYEPAEKQTATISGRPRNQVLIWVIGICAVAAIAAGAVVYSNMQTTHSAAASDQSQALNQQASSSQQAAEAAQQTADQAQTRAATLAAGAKQDRHAATLAAARAESASKAAPTN